MRLRTLSLFAVGALLAAAPGTATADSNRDRATGGGQVLLDPNDPPTTGALDTIAFVAHREKGAAANSSLADGQVQVNRRSGNQVKFHGIVECLVVVGTRDGGKAYISGRQRGTNTPFELYVVDGGGGANERGADQMLLWYGPETGGNGPDQIGQFTPPEEEYCGIEEDPSSKRQIPAVARGNTQVYDANPSSPPPPPSPTSASSRTAATKATSLLSALR